jgi:Flp pilus assembly protein TadG
MSRRRSQGGSTLIEGPLVFLVFAILMAGVMELGLIGFAANAVTFAAHRAARFASLRGASSGHPATISEIQASGIAYAAPLNSSGLNVLVTWLPNNQPGNSVQVTVAYAIRPAVLPISAGPLTLQSTARARIAQ